MDDLTMENLNKFITDNSIPREEILNINVEVQKEDAPRAYKKKLLESLDYIIDDENVILSQGRWMRFNEDYINQLNEYVDDIDLEIVESELKETSLTEPEFSKYCESFGYINADKDFSKIKVAQGTLIEAWDLQKDTTVYALKFSPKNF